MSADIAMRPPAARGAIPWRTAFSTSGCNTRLGTSRSNVLAGISRWNLQAIAKAHLLDLQIFVEILHLTFERDLLDSGAIQA